MNDEDRKDPEAFLDLLPHTKKGELKVYLGGAAGVGKTYRMLEEAHQLREQGHDIVLGFIETHGRAETAARIGDLELVPLLKIPYRGVTLEEMDVDAIIARKPEFAVVDELAHTNAAGSHHSKRYQDVEELTAAGINVITAFNVQHLESLNQMVRRITGVEIRETIPDTFLTRAGQVVTVDISVEELRQRLREGKIYPPEQVERALLDNVNLAADLGAEVVWLKSPDVTKALLDFAHEHNMSRIIVGRTRPGLLRRILRRSVTERLVYEARDFDVEIVGSDTSAGC